MNSIDRLAVEAKERPKAMETLIKDHKRFILYCIYRTTHRYSDEHQDEFSVAIEAFSEASQKYKPDKGHFLPFAFVVIQRRLLDFNRKESQEKTIPVDPLSLAGNIQQEQLEYNPPANLQAPTSWEDDTLKWEIEAIKDILNNYSISFFDLAKNSPKAEKTKTACAKAAGWFLHNGDEINRMRQKKVLPLEKMQKETGIPRKTMERHRKYIIAVVEILNGDYPHLADYLKPVRKEAIK